MPQPESFARQARLLHLTGMLRAANARRLMRKGRTPAQAAREAGYSTTHDMHAAIRNYIKSPASTPIESGADQKTLPTR